MARRSTIGTNPLDLVIPKKTAKKPKPVLKKKPAPKPEEPVIERERLTVQIPVETVERARNAAYWERLPLAWLVEEGLKMVVDKMERHRGEIFEERAAALKSGRPFKRK